MNQKVFVLIFLGIVTLVTLGLLVSKLFQNSQPDMSSDQNNSLNSTIDQSTNSEFAKQTPSPTLPSKKYYPNFPGELSLKQLQNKKAIIQTKKGVIEFEIYPEATKAASNFIKLSQDGYYDSLTFHRVEPGFVIQGGDPRGNGTGGPGYLFEDEPITRKYLRGTVAMANSGPNTNGSQFFIMLEDRLDLPPRYTIFGKVIKGQEVVEAIKVGDVMDKVLIQSLK